MTTPDRASDPSQPFIQSDYGRRVLPDGRGVPSLMMTFMCPVCGTYAKMDAYRGVPLCSNHTTPHPICEPLLGDPEYAEELIARQMQYELWATDPRGIAHRPSQ